MISRLPEMGGGIFYSTREMTILPAKLPVNCINDLYNKAAGEYTMMDIDNILK